MPRYPAGVSRPASAFQSVMICDWISRSVAVHVEVFVAGLEESLSATIARIRSGVFEPTPSEFACSGCPALDVVCAGPRLPGSGPRPAPELAAVHGGA